MELRRLFALAVSSKRKYLDPSKAVDILKEAFAPTATAGTVDSQQDVSEFQHKLLEWLEDAFRYVSMVTSHSCSQIHQNVLSSRLPCTTEHF